MNCRPTTEASTRGVYAKPGIPFCGIRSTPAKSPNTVPQATTTAAGSSAPLGAFLLRLGPYAGKLAAQQIGVRIDVMFDQPTGE